MTPGQRARSANFAGNPPRVPSHGGQWGQFSLAPYTGKWACSMSAQGVGYAWSRICGRRISDIGGKR